MHKVFRGIPGMYSLLAILPISAVIQKKVRAGCETQFNYVSAEALSKLWYLNFISLIFLI